MPPATHLWQERVDKAVAVDEFATRYGWDYETIMRQPTWLVDLLPVVWSVRRELGGH